MGISKGLIIGELVVCDLSCFMVDRLARQSGCVCQNLHLAGSFEVIQVVEGPGDTASDDDHTMVGQKQDPAASQSFRDTVSLFIVQSETSIIIVVSDVVVEPQRILADHLQSSLVQRRDRCSVRHVSVQNAASMRYTVVNAPVDKQRRGFDFALPFDHITLRINQQQVPGLHFLPVHPNGIDQEVPIVHGVRVVIANAFAEAKLRRPAKNGRKIAASFYVTRHEVAVRDSSCSESCLSGTW